MCANKAKHEPLVYHNKHDKIRKLSEFCRSEFQVDKHTSPNMPRVKEIIDIMVWYCNRIHSWIEECEALEPCHKEIVL